MRGILDYGVFGKRAPNQGLDDLADNPLTFDAKRKPDQAAPVPSPASTLAPPVSLAAPGAGILQIPPIWLAAGAAGLVLLILAGRR